MSQKQDMPRKTGSLLQRAGDRLRSFGRKEDGSAAVEFALVVPIMLALYFGTLEISQGIEVNKKAGRASSLVADLITQQAIITRAELDAIAELGEAAIAPYNRDVPTVEMVGVQVTNDPVPRSLVVWSRRIKSGVGARYLPVNSVIAIPPELMIRNTFIIRAGLKLNYYPVTTYVVQEDLGDSKKGIPMGETYYLRPRTSPTVACPDC